MSSTPRLHPIVVVGSANADLLVRLAAPPAPGETVLGASLDIAPGGKGANQAVAAALQGAEVGFVGAVGTDTFATTVRDGLAGAGVQLDCLEVVDGPTGVAIVTVTDDAENSIIVVPGANASVDAAAVTRHAAQIAAAAIVVLQGEIPRAGIETAARLARGRLIVNLAPVLEVDPAVLIAADPLIVNEHEAAAVAALLAPDFEPASDERELIAALRGHGIPSVVLTLGARGALVEDGNGITEVAAPTVEAVDTTGAGDAFVGALAAALAKGESLQEAARRAVRVGAFAVQGHGAQRSYPSLDNTLPQVESA